MSDSNTNTNTKTNRERNRRQLGLGEERTEKTENRAENKGVYENSQRTEVCMRTVTEQRWV